MNVTFTVIAANELDFRFSSSHHLKENKREKEQVNVLLEIFEEEKIVLKKIVMLEEKVILEERIMLEEKVTLKEKKKKVVVVFRIKIILSTVTVVFPCVRDTRITKQGYTRICLHVTT
jgi:hypothetical protein